jgi:hypothetical protein
MRYKDDVWMLTNALTVEEVIEIRCIAENEKIPLEAYLNADDTKEKRFKRPPKKK